MAGWSYTTNDVLTNKRWAKLMLVQMMQETWFLRLASKEDGLPIQIIDDLQKHSGDQVTFGLSNLLSGRGVMDLATLTGNEEAPQTFGDSLFIHELAHATLLVGPISNQRVLFDQRKIGRGRLADWYAARTDHAAANQLGSFTPQTDVAYTGLQATIGVSTSGVVNGGSGRQILPSGVNDAASINSTMPFVLGFIDTAVNRAKSLTTGIRPVKIGGRSFFILVMHNSQVTDMRQNVTTGQWLDIQKAAMTGGDIGDNPIWWQAIGMYHGTLLHENPRITNSVSNAGLAVANTKRAIFLGAQAAMLAFGRASGETQKFQWLEELRDYGRQLGIGVSAIWGLKKTVFNNQDFAAMALDTFGLDTDALNSAQTNSQ